MFENIGNKIKTLATVLTILGMAFSAVLALVMCSNGRIGAGLLVLFLGFVFSWIGSFCLYGFGELIEKTTEIAQNTGKFDQTKKSTCSTVNTSDAFNSYGKTSAEKSTSVSGFLTQIPSVGTIVENKENGEGKVTGLRDEEVFTVKFKFGEQKVFTSSAFSNGEIEKISDGDVFSRQIIRHKKYGDGEIIKKENKKVVSVNFANGKAQNFFYPDAFQSGILNLK